MSTSSEMRYEEALRRLAEYLDHELDEASRAAVESHLQTCRSCYSRSDFERKLKERLAALGVAEVPRSLEKRIQRLINDAK